MGVFLPAMISCSVEDAASIHPGATEFRVIPLRASSRARLPTNPHHTGFRGTIGAFAGIADDRIGDRGDVDDAPITRGQHERQKGLRDVESRFEIDGYAVIPLLLGEFS
jgi:hypothetical protein